MIRGLLHASLRLRQLARFCIMEALYVLTGVAVAVVLCDRVAPNMLWLALKEPETPLEILGTALGPLITAAWRPLGKTCGFSFPAAAPLSTNHPQLRQLLLRHQHHRHHHLRQLLLWQQQSPSWAASFLCKLPQHLRLRQLLLRQSQQL